MSENTKSEPARINARRSRGPVTAEGKARSVKNSTRHGQYAKPAWAVVHNILLRCEYGAAYQDLLQCLFQDSLPTNSFERGLIRELCAIEWLLSRNLAIETRIPDVQIAAECDAIRQAQGNLRGIVPVDPMTLATEKLLGSSTFLPHCEREFLRPQRARRELLNTFFSVREHQKPTIRSTELTIFQELGRQTATGAIHRNEPTGG
ncbi:MAG: hypothetical protein QM757_42885 [Paludibaculum sp.]